MPIQLTQLRRKRVRPKVGVPEQLAIGSVAGHPHDLLGGQSLLEQPPDRLMAERRRAMEIEKVEQGFPAEEGKEEGTTSVPLEMTEGDSFLVRTGTANPSIGVAVKRWGEPHEVHMMCEEVTENGKRLG